MALIGGVIDDSVACIEHIQFRDDAALKILQISQFHYRIMRRRTLVLRVVEFILLLLFSDCVSSDARIDRRTVPTDHTCRLLPLLLYDRGN